MIYGFDITLFINRYLPNILVQPIKAAWCFCLLAPVEEIRQSFLTYRTDTLAQLDYSGETMVVEFLLNREFNGGGTDIWIENFLDIAPGVFVGHASDPGHLIFVGHNHDGGSPVFIAHAADYVDTAVDFTVHVPVSLVYDSDAFNALIRKYKYAGRRYNIATY